MFASACLDQVFSSETVIKILHLKRHSQKNSSTFYNSVDKHNLEKHLSHELQQNLSEKIVGETADKNIELSWMLQQLGI